MYFKMNISLSHDEMLRLSEPFLIWAIHQKIVHPEVFYDSLMLQNKIKDYLKNQPSSDHYVQRIQSLYRQDYQTNMVQSRLFSFCVFMFVASALSVALSFLFTHSSFLLVPGFFLLCFLGSSGILLTKYLHLRQSLPALITQRISIAQIIKADYFLLRSWKDKKMFENCPFLKKLSDLYLFQKELEGKLVDKPMGVFKILKTAQGNTRIVHDVYSGYRQRQSEQQRENREKIQAMGKEVIEKNIKSDDDYDDSFDIISESEQNKIQQTLDLLLEIHRKSQQ